MIRATNSRKRNYHFLMSFFLIFSLLISSVTPALASPRQEKLRISFSEAVEKSQTKAAKELDKVATALFHQLDKSENITVKVQSHFYDARIRRYFLSLNGETKIQKLLLEKVKNDEFIITGDGEISFDISFTKIKNSETGHNLAFNGAIVVSMDRLAYKMIQTVPHLAASGALTPAFDLLSEFLQKLNIGILSKAISETIKSFSKVTFTKTCTELISAAGKNGSLKKLIQDTMRDGSILNFLAMQIVRCSSLSLVSVAGASLGATIGSIVAPGPGSVIGAYLGSQIMTLATRTILYHVTAKIPMQRNIKRMLTANQILQMNPDDEIAANDFATSMRKIEKKVTHELNSERFSLFSTMLKEIDKLSAKERLVMVPLLKRIQSTLQFRVVNEGDWYFARKYYLLKQYVDKWELNTQVVFTTDKLPENR